MTRNKYLNQTKKLSNMSVKYCTFVISLGKLESSPRFKTCPVTIGVDALVTWNSVNCVHYEYVDWSFIFLLPPGF